MEAGIGAASSGSSAQETTWKAPWPLTSRMLKSRRFTTLLLPAIQRPGMATTITESGSHGVFCVLTVPIALGVTPWRGSTEICLNEHNYLTQQEK
uniref:Subolesin-interacting protein GI n=1 Tax=Rhipicephalus microplus TaxID=6941 RepID=B5L665_RHIMP|nr:subolesin-interacting protein GI [Rhipicephalus microplus]